MNTEPIVKEIIISASTDAVWSALTDKDQMKVWYFDLPEFRAEKGFKFEFYAETADGNRYLHVCEVKEAIKGQKLSYSWQYHGYEGYSIVTFELFQQGEGTLLRLTHEGLHSFPSENKDFARENFNGGWEAILRDSLRNHVEH